MHLVNESRGLLLADRLQVADTFLARAVGLIGSRPLRAGEGLLIIPCRAVHTWFMGFPIDVAFLDAQGTLVSLWPRVAPFRLRQADRAPGRRGPGGGSGAGNGAAPGPGTHPEEIPPWGPAVAALELPEGMLVRSGSSCGDRVAFRRGAFRVQMAEMVANAGALSRSACR